MNKNSLNGMIGLEIHCYPVTKEKLFCKCINSRERGIQGNVNICEICTGQPGAKPMLPNEEAVKKAVLIGLMLGCKINSSLVWKRKHYSWPDMPKGFQNTISGSNALSLGVDGKFNGIRIRSMHLEEDPASWEPDTGRVDYNRSGLPLIEIITEPDFVNSEEVMDWLKKLVHNLSYLKAIDPNAGIKVDVNVSIPNKTERVEIKNINSIENIGRAIDYEIERQLNEGNKKKQTRRFDSIKGNTVVMREKEEADDYRFISDPDLQPLVLGKNFVEEIKERIPESPEVKLDKLIKKYKIDRKNAEILAKNIDVVSFYEQVVEQGKLEPAFVLPWVTIELLRVLNYNKTSLEGVNVKVEHFISLIKMVKDKKITELQAKQILSKFYPQSFDPNQVEGRIDNENELEKVAREVIKENPKSSIDYKNGEGKALNFLMGEMMKKTNRRADYSIAKKVLERLLK